MSSWTSMPSMSRTPFFAGYSRTAAPPLSGAAEELLVYDPYGPPKRLARHREVHGHRRGALRDHLDVDPFPPDRAKDAGSDARRRRHPLAHAADEREVAPPEHVLGHAALQALKRPLDALGLRLVDEDREVRRGRRDRVEVHVERRYRLEDARGDLGRKREARAVEPHGRELVLVGGG